MKISGLYIYGLYLDGDLTAEQALNALAIEARFTEQTPEAVALGEIIQRAARGDVPIEMLKRALAVDETTKAPASVAELENVTDVASGAKLKLAEVQLTVTRSAGDDRAVLVFVDTQFEPDGSDGGPGLRVLVNANEAYVGKAYDFGAHHEAETRNFQVSLDDIAYTGREL